MTLFAKRKPAPLLESLPRLCNLLALGHFTASVTLGLVFRFSPAARHTLNFSVLAIVVGSLMITLGLFANLSRHREIVSKICFSILLAEVFYLIFLTRDLSHPVVMVLPILFLIAVPVLGNWSPYYLAGISFLYLFSLSSLSLSSHLDWPDLVFLFFGFLIIARISNFMWTAVFQKETELEAALLELEKRAAQMESWVEELVRITSLTGVNHITLALPTTPPYESFAALAANLEHLQTKLGHYFGGLVVRDRLNNVALLASGLAHELNTPLTTLEFLIASRKDSLPANLFDGLSDEIKRMGLITREFLSLTGTNHPVETLDLNGVVRETISVLERMKTSPITIETALEAKGIPFQGTRNQMSQVMINIFRNAVDATAGKTPAVFRIETGVTAMGEGRLVLKDNGCGIEPDALSKIYDPFFTTKAPGKGTGLGLYIVREILEQHYASLTVKSAPNEGTQFEITFPRGNSTHKQKEAA